ncbi:Serine protease inhibitor 27A [Cryptotermes secundus]|uniref:Serine protease inhibitor 27A n=1 Tax=Cryptotermes secundus TaxID=105785 RepID=A0A2J7QEP9_9NEOP|nr:Serine protease inhibitor 27A [Cryptotermes secundus]
MNTSSALFTTVLRRLARSSEGVKTRDRLTRFQKLSYMAKLGATGPQLAVLLVVLLVAGAEPAETPANPDYYDDDDEFVPASEKENFDVFDWQLCKHLSAQEPGNVVVSPVSIKLVLAMLYEGAAGNTAREMEHALHLPARLQTRKKFTTILDSLMMKKAEYLLDVGTRMFVSRDVNLRPRFSKILQSFYNASIQKMDFGQPAEAAQTVNSWVSEATNGRIKSMFSEDSVSPSTVMLLVNAIYFKGLWRYPFNESETKQDVFQVTPTHSAKVPFMTMERDLYLSESVELDSAILRLPYMGKKYSMFIVLPNKPDGLNKLLDTVSPALLRNQLFHMDKVLVNVKLPKFSFDFTAKLEDTLQALGIRDIFNAAGAHLPGIARDKTFYVSKIIQKAGLEVNERGTTAFASTGMELKNKFGGDVYFHAKHPFMFFIQDETTGTVIFVGKLNNPSTELIPLSKPDDASVAHIEPQPGVPQSRFGAEDSHQHVPDKAPLPTSRSPKGTLTLVSANNVMDSAVPAHKLDTTHKVWTYIYRQLLKQYKNNQWPRNLQ